MKQIISRNIICFSFSALLFLSCEALPFNYSKSQSWPASENMRGTKTAIRLLGVKVDRPGGWDSVEKEFSALAPLYFWEQGFAAVSAGERADYAAQVQVREREYSSGWRTRRSLAVEVRIWAADAEAKEDMDQKLPLVAGRVVSIGERSFSSSDTVGRMLAKAVQKAVKKLPPKGAAGG